MNEWMNIYFSLANTIYYKWEITWMTFTMQFTAQNIIRGVVNFIFNKENVPYFNDLATNCRHYIMKHTLMGKQNKALILVYTKRQKHIYPIRKHETTK